MRQGLDQTTVVKTAALLAERDGYESVTLASVAKELGIKTPSLYNHVNGLKGLRKDLACYAIEQLAHQLTLSAVGRSGDEAILSVGFSYIQFVRDHPGLYEATFRAPDLSDPDIMKKGDYIVQLLVAILNYYHLADEDLIHAVRALRSLVHGFAMIEMNRGFNLSVDNEETIQFMLRTFINGLPAQTH
ncbi:TetR/AcrR family transcriptional regulator [Priestia koreensis]|uniref:TetR family transcriptional regulator n=1 Tax=Priestia koreensis TaxID=284581 RepID=A0A0M0KYG9_9BACI|nr:TetR/AcrR family transcriptional regulator [Priestia koreensis]KOO43438.1 TetR family transcriptional regulator [Priestia koreensis]